MNPMTNIHFLMQKKVSTNIVDVDMDITWMNEDCQFYQQNENFMEFLKDCAVVVLITGDFQLPIAIRAICEMYKNLEPVYVRLQTFEETMIPHPILTDDLALISRCIKRSIWR